MNIAYKERITLLDSAKFSLLYRNINKEQHKKHLCHQSRNTLVLPTLSQPIKKRKTAMWLKRLGKPSRFTHERAISEREGAIM